MELEELSRRLLTFARAKYDDPGVSVSRVHNMPGHAGFSYGFTVVTETREESWFLRMPPPNVKWRGTADVLRQVAALNALDGTDIPHCSVKWCGDDLEWFGCPYFIVPALLGDVARFEPGGWGTGLSPETRRDMARQAMRALAEIHRVDPAKAPYLGDPVPFAQDVTRWDRFYQRAADPERLALVPRLRERLLESLPENAPTGIFHGDFQWSNLFYSFDGKLLAIIDWELTGIGATLNDVGWIATFSDPLAWQEGYVNSGVLPPSDELVAIYEEAWGAPLPDLRWYRALAAYKFAIITGFNLSLHRRGKREDPVWEITRLSMTNLTERALELLRLRGRC
jgi:aminoglycoside phosphotransferase (APT) family kinase protein